MHTIILKEEDMLKENHFPIIALLNEAYSTDIMAFIKELNRGIGSGYNYTTCSFWDELDDYDKENISHYDGIMIETEDGETLCLSMTEMLDYLMLLQSRVAFLNSDLAEQIADILVEYRKIYIDAL